VKRDIQQLFKGLVSKKVIPIFRNEFEKGEKIPSIYGPVLRFLVANEDKAFSIDEIEKNIFMKEDQKPAHLIILNDVLARLQRLKLVEARSLAHPDASGYTVYFAAKRARP
jgi:hypothetical protein